MASKAAQDSRARVKSPKYDAFLIMLAQRNGIAVERAIPRQSVFAIGFRADSGNRGDGLETRTEGPIAALGRGRWRKRMGVRSTGLRCEIRRVAGAAGIGSRIIGRTRGEGNGRQNQGRQGDEA